MGSSTWKKRRNNCKSICCSFLLPTPPTPHPRLKPRRLSDNDMIVLSGSHTIEKARCATFRTALDDDANTTDPSYAMSLQRKCPRDTVNNNTLFPLDVQNENVFDNNYYKNQIQKKGLFHPDRVLYNGTSADSTVACFANSQNKSFKEFGMSMIKMGRIQPAAGTKLEVRRNCKKPNSLL